VNRLHRPARPSAAKLLAALSAAVLASTTIGSCAGDGPTGPPAPPAVASILVAPGADTIVTLGRTRTFIGTPRDSDGLAIAGITLRWRSSDTLVARVDSITGVMTAVGEGSAEIAAVAGLITGTAMVHVIQFVAGVTITPGTSTLVSVGQQQALTAVARDSSNAVVAGVRFLWTSSNPGVAVVDTLGVARAQASGTVTISATGRGTPGHAEVVVNQAATHLAFTVEPTSAVAGTPLSPAVQVEIRDASGARVTTARNAITLAFGFSNSAGVLAGTKTVNAIDGVASFSGLWIDKVGGYKLAASAAGMTPDTNNTFFAISPGPIARLEPGLELEYEAGVGPEFPALVYGYDAFDNEVTPTGVTASLVFDASRPLLAMEMATTTSPQAGRMDFSGPVFDRPARDVRIRFIAGTATAFSDPITVRTTPTAFTTGGSHACMIATTNSFCWGSGLAGQLGNGGVISTGNTLLVPVVGGEDFTQLTGGADFTCGLKSDGAAFCWGGSFGHFGAATAITGTGPGGVQFIQIDAGYTMVCGRTAVGEAYCWGSNDDGLGDGVSTSSATPVLVLGTGSPGLQMTSVSVGFRHACALNAAGEAHCWGQNTSGQLGDSTLVNKPTPVLVAGTGTGARVFTQISAGHEHTCAIANTGAASCWGGAQFGALGTAGNGFRVPQPIDINPWVTQNFTSISAGQNFTCGVAGGVAVCWGLNASGQLGNGTFENQTLQAPVASLPFVSSVSVGAAFACAKSGPVIYCWGANGSQQLGVGTTGFVAHPLPVQVRHR
jgi:hypothetical protein